MIGMHSYGLFRSGGGTEHVRIWKRAWGRFAAGAVLLSLTGCGLGSLANLLAASEEDLQELNRRIEALDTLNVRIVNNTTEQSQVFLEAYITAPSSLAFFEPDSSLTSVATRDLLIMGGGEATGTIPCGESIRLWVRAPHDVSGPEYDLDGYALFPGEGNISFTGIGRPDNHFSGDLVSGDYYINPAEDGVDCTSDVLVVEINTAARDEVIDEETGEVLEPVMLGTGEVSVE